MRELPVRLIVRAATPARHLFLACPPDKQTLSTKLIVSAKSTTETTRSFQSAISSKLASSLASKLSSTLSSTTTGSVGVDSTKLEESLEAAISSELSASVSTELSRSASDALSTRNTRELIVTREEEVKRELSNTNACHRLEVYFYQMFHVYRVGLVANSGTLLVRVRRFEKSAEDVYSQKIELDKRYTLPLPPAGLALGSVDIRLPLPALCPISKPIYAPECCPATLRNASTIPGSAGGTGTRTETEEERRVGLIPDVPKEGVYAAALVPPLVFNERLEDLTPNDGAFAFLSEVVTPLNAGGRCADRMPDLAVLSRYRRALDPDGVLYGVVHAIDESIYDLIDPSLEAGAPPAAGEKGVPGDLTAIEGIGERYAAALRQQGATSIPGLAEVDLDAIRLAGVSRSRLEAWQWMARLKLARPELSANALEFLVSGLGVRDPQEVEGVARSATAEAVASAVGRLKLPQDFDVGAVLASLRGTEI